MAMGESSAYSSPQADSEVKFAPRPTSWRTPGADRLSLRRTIVNSHIRLCAVNDSTVNMVLCIIIIIIIITVYGNMFDLKVKPKLATHITQSFHPRRSLLASVTRNSRGSSIGFPPRETFLLRKIDCTSCSAPRMIEVTPLGDTVKSGSTEAGR